MKIGYCCKFKPTKEMTEGLSKKEISVLEQRYNLKTTTVKKLQSLAKNEVFDKLLGLVVHNIEALENQISWVAQQPKEMRLLRIGSEFVPAATHPDFRWFFHHPHIHSLLEFRLGEIGKIAKHNNIRLSFHPGQFCVLNSINEQTVENSIEEFEYHTILANMLGYGRDWHEDGFAINVHTGSRTGGLERLVDTIENRLSPEARNLITIENDEFSFGLDDLLKAKDKFAIVLDIHHHLIHSEEYIESDDPRVELVKESWRGTRPLGHLSTSQETLLIDHDVNKKPDIKNLLENGFKKTQLRAHSNFCWNHSVNDWAVEHLKWMDIEVEAKEKNLASRQLYDNFIGKRY